MLTQRPDLFGAALPAVGVLDMLRYHTASANARQWSTDYGLSEDAEDFKAQSRIRRSQREAGHAAIRRRSSPRPTTTIASCRGTASSSPPRCRTRRAAPNPVLIRVETRAGHGAGKPVWMQIEDFADQWAFVANALGMPAAAADVERRFSSGRRRGLVARQSVGADVLAGNRALLR